MNNNITLYNIRLFPGEDIQQKKFSGFQPCKNMFIKTTKLSMTRIYYHYQGKCLYKSECSYVYTLLMMTDS